MSEKKYLLMDDTNQSTFEDVEAFEATLDPETLSSIKAETRSIFDEFHAKRKNRAKTAA